jgi:hypothetical protein
MIFFQNKFAGKEKGINFAAPIEEKGIEEDKRVGAKKRLKFFEKLEANKKPGKERQQNLFNS